MHTIMIMWAYRCGTVVQRTAQNSSNYFPPNLQTITTAQMLSILVS